MAEYPARLGPRGETLSKSTPVCRFCSAADLRTFVDLGMSPLCNTQIEAHGLNSMEPFYPLHARVCAACFLVQLPEFAAPADIFSEYAYFSSFADSWLEHSRRFAESMRERLKLSAQTLVVEIASNDGYLLQYFASAGIPVLGVEPAANVARAAEQKGIRTDVSFHGSANARRLVAEVGRATLLVGNNVLAHVPDLNDFVTGLKILLAPDGVITMEFPHLQRLMEHNQFDTIYHEHFSYFSFITVEKVFAAHGLRLFDVEELSTHGGSLRIYARHAEDAGEPVSERLVALRRRELELGFDRIETYGKFDEQVRNTKRNILDLLIQIRRSGKRIAGYGAPGKGNTLLNYCGIRTDFVDYTVDRNPYKQGKFTPGTHIPVYAPEKIRATRPDYLLILPWNLRAEITTQMAYVRDWGCKFIVPIPRPEIID
jgi:SAM-dependent methyltransferase